MPMRARRVFSCNHSAAVVAGFSRFRIWSRLVRHSIVHETAVAFLLPAYQRRVRDQHPLLNTAPKRHERRDGARAGLPSSYTAGSIHRPEYREGGSGDESSAA